MLNPSNTNQHLQCTIVDYGMGNLGSIQNMLARIYVRSIVTSDRYELEKAEFLILPGVGAFDTAIERLRKLGIIDVMNAKVMEEGTPVLGICLGMQLMLDSSEEGRLPGLGWVPGLVRRLQPPIESGLKVPHMGWNNIMRRSNKAQFDISTNLEHERFYFVHSYAAHCANPEDALATTTHGEVFDSVVGRKNILGFQFHPEKSHVFGLNLFKQVFSRGQK